MRSNEKKGDVRHRRELVTSVGKLFRVNMSEKRVMKKGDFNSGSLAEASLTQPSFLLP